MCYKLVNVQLFGQSSPKIVIACIITPFVFFLIYKFIYLFIIYFWLHWVFVAALGLSLVAASGGYASLQCMGFSLRRLLLLRSTGSRHEGFSSCGARA